jgi:hypothetical protein
MRGSLVAPLALVPPLALALFGALAAVALVPLAGCARPSADENECTGQAPACFEPIAANVGCCAEAGVPAECGPKDAPRGTHLKWVCPGKSVRATECTAYGAVCATHVDQIAPSLATPHAVPLPGDPTAGLPAAWLAAPVGTVVDERIEALGGAYSVRHSTTRVSGPDAVKQRDELVFGKDRLTERRYFVAPAGDYVVFEDAGGKTVVHAAASAKRRDATPRPIEPPTGATFDPQKRTATITFAKHAPVVARLP